MALHAGSLKAIGDWSSREYRGAECTLDSRVWQTVGAWVYVDDFEAVLIDATFLFNDC